MRSLSLIFPLVFALPSISLRIILPLYLYPGDSTSAWDSVTSTISSHPSVDWLVIINPNSGPGTKGAPTDPNIVSGIAKLNSYPNVQTVGYVDTAHGARPIADVNAEVDVYAGWTSSGSASLKIGGIYFDDVSAETTSSMYSYYQGAAEHARSSIPSAHVAFNPGTIAPTQYFSYCDTMVEFEASYSDYQSQNPIQKIPEEFREKTALQVYSTPEDTDVGSLVQTMAGDGVEAVYFGTDCCYKVFSATLLKATADAVMDGGTCSDEL